jgi:putative membrane protein
MSLPVVLAGAAIAVQIAHPLLDGAALRTATVAAVLLFAAASLASAAGRAAGDAVRLLVVAGGVGWIAEAVGVATGLPFGEYRYAGSLGPQLLGVPLLVPLAWTMMAYPCLLLGRRLARRRPARIALAAGTLAAWDLFLDPQMVADGHWTWAHPTPALPGVPGIPLTNYAGWVLVALVLTTLLDLALPHAPGRRDEPAPALLLGWTWLGSTLGNLAFFDRPAVAAYGGLVMGATVLPYLLAVRRSAAGRERPLERR